MLPLSYSSTNRNIYTAYVDTFKIIFNSLKSCILQNVHLILEIMTYGTKHDFWGVRMSRKSNQLGWKSKLLWNFEDLEKNTLTQLFPLEFLQKTFHIRMGRVEYSMKKAVIVTPITHVDEPLS